MIILDCLRKYRLVGLLLSVTEGLQLIIFLLYRIPLEPFFYTLVLTLFSTAICFIVTFFREYDKAGQRERCMQYLPQMPAPLPPADSLAEEDLQKIISSLKQNRDDIQLMQEKKNQETEEYLTAWMHQIKTPIAVLRMSLLDGTQNDALFRLERYVEMLLNYNRLSTRENDLVVAEYSLDEMIRDIIRKYAALFISNKVSLIYEGTDWRIVTDRKWFCCMLEQFISNAIKYAPGGRVEIAAEEDGLRISDTGIGIAPEDLPRIFEKGYTGINGRSEKHSSGLGLYLAQLAAKKLSIKISAQSKVGEGSSFFLYLKQEKN